MGTLLSPAVQKAVAGGSAIRKMFEQGIELKKKFGADNVYDFSLGNPDLAPPPAVKAALETIAAGADRPFSLGYMPNAGYPATREALARLVSKEQGVAVPAANVVVTVGAAGGLNVLFRAVLSPGDKVLVPSPYFVEYGNYTGNFGGVLTPVPTKPGDFSLLMTMGCQMPIAKKVITAMIIPVKYIANQYVNTSTPCSVINRVCSHCALGFSSSVITSHS